MAVLRTSPALHDDPANDASEQMRLIMSGTAGKGMLHFNGKDYRFTFKSASGGLGAKAVKKMSATGNVYFLNGIEDFPGK